MRKPKTFKAGSLQAACSAADEKGEEMPKEQEAIEAGLALVDAQWDGQSHFDRGMRLLQQKLGIKQKQKRNETGSRGGCSIQ